MQLIKFLRPLKCIKNSSSAFFSRWITQNLSLRLPIHHIPMTRDHGCHLRTSEDNCQFLECCLKSSLLLEQLFHIPHRLIPLHQLWLANLHQRTGFAAFTVQRRRGCPLASNSRTSLITCKVCARRLPEKPFTPPQTALQYAHTVPPKTWTSPFYRPMHKNPASGSDIPTVHRQR